jgi:hypothetical protein
MLDKQVSWLFLCWNMILLGSFYDTMTNKQHEIVFLDTNNNFKHLIFIRGMPVTPYCKKKNYICLPIFLKYLSSLFIDLKIMGKKVESATLKSSLTSLGGPVSNAVDWFISYIVFKY